MSNLGWRTPLGVLAVGAVAVLMAGQGGQAVTVFSPVALTRLTSPEGPGNNFASSVAVDGDVVVVGKFGKSPGSDPTNGAAYVYERGADGWALSQKLTASDGRAGDRFGVDVAVSGDRIVVGAEERDDGGRSETGAAYVFVRSGTSWVQEAKLNANNFPPYALFGRSVSIDGDVIAVGAYLSNEQDYVAGAAYVFARSGSAWIQQARLSDANPGRGVQYGIDVSVSGNSVAVGTWADRFVPGALGRVDVWTRSGTTWSRQATLTAGDGVSGDWFGQTVALHGDVLAVGAREASVQPVVADLLGSHAGAVYVFSRASGAWSQTQKLTSLVPANGTSFGVHIALDADSLAVSSPYPRAVPLLGLRTGTLAVFSLVGGTWLETSRPIALDGAASDHLGSVGISGTTLVAGAPGHNAGSGGVYVFDGLPP